MFAAFPLQALLKQCRLHVRKTWGLWHFTPHNFYLPVFKRLFAGNFFTMQSFSSNTNVKVMFTCFDYTLKLRGENMIVYFNFLKYQLGRQWWSLSFNQKVGTLLLKSYRTIPEHVWGLLFPTSILCNFD